MDMVKMIDKSKYREAIHAVPEHAVKCLLRGMAREAELWGSLAADFLDQHFRPALGDGNLSFPAGFLVDLGAARRLTEWETEGITQYLVEPSLPIGRVALAQVLDNLIEGKYTATGAPRDMGLVRSVLRVWIRHFAWTGTELLGGDVVVHFDAPTEDTLADLLASFLFDAYYAQVSGAGKLAERN